MYTLAPSPSLPFTAQHSYDSLIILFDSKLLPDLSAMGIRDREAGSENENNARDLLHVCLLTPVLAEKKMQYTKRSSEVILRAKT